MTVTSTTSRANNRGDRQGVDVTDVLGPRFMREEEAPAVRALYALCHPRWPDKPPRWWQCHPTLVLIEGDRIIGSTSFSLSIAPSEQLASYGDDVCYGHDVCVAPQYRKRGYGQVLHEARFDICRQFGVKLFLGMTWATNAPMVRLFEKSACKKWATIIGAYPTEASHDGLVYIAPVTDDGTTKGA